MGLVAESSRPGSGPASPPTVAFKLVDPSARSRHRMVFGRPDRHLYG